MPCFRWNKKKSKTFSNSGRISASFIIHRLLVRWEHYGISMALWVFYRISWFQKSQILLSQIWYNPLENDRAGIMKQKTSKNTKRTRNTLREKCANNLATIIAKQKTRIASKFLCDQTSSYLSFLPGPIYCKYSDFTPRNFPISTAFILFY